MGIISRNSASPELMEFLSRKGATWSFEEEKNEPWKAGADRGRLYGWKVIPMEAGYVLIHLNPGRIINDPDAMFKLHEAIRLSCSLNLQNTRYLAQGIDEPELGVRSFCISFFKTYHWRDLSELFLKNLEEDFHRRLH